MPNIFYWNSSVSPLVPKNFLWYQTFYLLKVTFFLTPIFPTLFYREPPASAPHETESTPIHATGATIRDRSSRLSTILPHFSAAAAEEEEGGGKVSFQSIYSF